MTVDALRGTLPEPPVARRKRLQADWGFADLEMRDVVNAGLVELVEETVAAGASPAAARKWWSGEIARRANAEGQDVPTYAAGLGVGPASVVELETLVTSGRLNDSMARQVWEGVLSGEGGPTAVADARGLELVQDTGALEAAVDAVIAANPDVADKIRDGKVAGGRCAHRPGHAGDEGPGRRRRGPRPHPGEARPVLTRTRSDQ